LRLPIELEKNDLTAIEAPTRRDLSANVANFPVATRMVKAGVTVKARGVRSMASAPHRPTRNSRFGVQLPPSSLWV
jgi:hypothetical protein